MDEQAKALLTIIAASEVWTLARHIAISEEAEDATGPTHVTDAHIEAATRHLFGVGLKMNRILAAVTP